MQITNPLLSNYVAPLNGTTQREQGGRSTLPVKRDDQEQSRTQALPSLIEQSQQAATQTFLPAQQRVNPLAQANNSNELALFRQNSNETFNRASNNIAPENRQAIAQYQQLNSARDIGNDSEGAIAVDVFV